MERIVEHLGMIRKICIRRGWIVALIALVFVLSSCRSSTLSPTSIPTTTVWSAASFTYSTNSGSIWQIDINGQRVELLAADGLQKESLQWSDGHRWLAYESWEFPELEEKRVETLFVINREGNDVRKIAGPSHLLTYRWDSVSRIRVGMADERTEGGPQKWNWFSVDIETGTTTRLKGESKHLPFQPRQPLESHRQKAPNGQWAVQVLTEDSMRVFYLLDAGGNRISPIYEQPVDVGREFFFWSKDSEWIIYMPLDEDDPYYGDLYLYHPATLSSKQLTNYKEDQGWPAMMSHFNWSPNGEWLLFALADSVAANQLCVIHFDYNPEVQCFNANWKSNNFPWSSDSRFVAFLTSVETDLYVLEVASGEIRNLTDNGDSQMENYITAY